MNAITYKEIFPLIKSDQMWIGSTPLSNEMLFNVTPDYQKVLEQNKKEGSAWRRHNGVVLGRLASACWFTNLDHKKRHENLPLFRYYEDDADMFPHYDNHDAINVDRTKDIPCDYEGVMGVPITFLDKHNPNQFEILGIANSARYIGDIPLLTIIDGRKIYNRILIRNLHPTPKPDPSSITWTPIPPDAS